MNLNFDIKEIQLLDFYCDKIKQRTFDEHDIYAFYILVRGHLENTEKYDKNNSTNSRKYKWISELGDLIAHRERREGVVWQNIVNALQNGYKTISGSQEILNYKGIADGELQNEFTHLLRELNCQVTAQILDEIVLCTFSILQSSRYVDKQKNIVGEVRLIQFIDGLGLITVGNPQDKKQPWVCLARLKGQFTTKEFPCWYNIKKPIEVIRHNGELAIKYDGQII